MYDSLSKTHLYFISSTNGPEISPLNRFIHHAFRYKRNEAAQQCAPPQRFSGQLVHGSASQGHRDALRPQQEKPLKHRSSQARRSPPLRRRPHSPLRSQPRRRPLATANNNVSVFSVLDIQRGLFIIYLFLFFESIYMIIKILDSFFD